MNDKISNLQEFGEAVVDVLDQYPGCECARGQYEVMRNIGSNSEMHLSGVDIDIMLGYMGNVIKEKDGLPIDDVRDIMVGVQNRLGMSDGGLPDSGN